MKFTFEELREMGCPNELLIQYHLSPEQVDLKVIIEALRKERDSALEKWTSTIATCEQLRKELENVKQLRVQDIKNLQDSQKERDEFELALECVSGAYQVSDLIRERDELYEALEELKMCGPDDGVWERADAVLEKYKK